MRAFILLTFLLVTSYAADSSENSFTKVAPIFAKHCLDCHAVDDPEVHEDGVVAAEEALPGPQRVALARRVVVCVGDHDLPPVGGGRVYVPALLRAAGFHRVPAVGEDLVVVAG